MDQGEELLVLKEHMAMWLDLLVRRNVNSVLKESFVLMEEFQEIVKLDTFVSQEILNLHLKEDLVEVILAIQDFIVR